MPLKARDVIRALEKKGFLRDNSKDIRFIYYTSEGRKSSISTMISHGEIEISDNLLRFMSRQLTISREKFGEFVACTLTQDGFEKIAKF
jgi:predicted RNA binding protein YcfA (HicA-like mRNA interferase family)